MKEEPLVSIGLTTYQRPKEFQRALKSILSQTYKNLEIIVSENHSPGFNIRKVIQGFLKRDKRIRYFQQRPNKGALFNGRFVLKKATGKYFMWAADDDTWAPNCITQLVGKLEANPRVGLAASAIKNTDRQGNSQIIRFNGRYNPNDKSCFNNYLTVLDFSRSNYVYFACGMFRRELLQKTHPQITNIYAVDRVFMILFSLVAPIAYIDKVLYFRQVQGPDNANEVKAFTWWGEILGISKLIPVILKSPDITWYRKFYLPIAVYKLSFRLAMLVIMRFLWVLFKASFFCTRQVEKLQTYLAHRYS